MNYLEPILKAADSVVVNDDTFNFLNLTGRKAYYAQGYEGEGIVCAIIDTGVNSMHEDLKDSANRARCIGGKSFCRYTEDLADDNGHGSHVAGSILGLNCGVAPKSKYLSVKVLDGSGSNDIDSIISGYEYVAKWRDAQGNPVDIACSSLSIPATEMTAEQITRFNEAIKAIVNAGIPMFVSAGNTGTKGGLRYPADFQEVISVGAVDVKRNVAYFSTRSPEVDICQVGVDIVSVDYQTSDQYCLKSGTSMSNPISVGTAILPLNKYKKMTGKRMPEPMLYDLVKNINSLDIAEIGIDKATGAGFFTLDPNPVIRVVMKIGDKNYTVNGVPKVFDVPPQVVPPGRTLLPVRDVTEGVGCTVEYVPSTEEVIVTR